MGTRADFYVGRGEDAEWIGSIAYDGYEIGDAVKATTEQGWRNAISGLASERHDFTSTALGWPWPWDDSCTTDYAYAFDGDRVWACVFGYEWFEADGPHPDEDAQNAWTVKTAVFPNMADRRNMPPLGSKASGLIVF